MESLGTSFVITSNVKRTLFIFVAMLLAGCASAGNKSANNTTPALSAVALENRPAAALVFTPPITMGNPALDLSRAGREPEAFWGYSQGVTDTYDVLLDDRQYTDPWTGGYRESFTERTGTLVH
jgi:hypothetical protein